jgi:epoxyqueuosine reductase
MENIKERIIKIAEEINIDCIGFTSAQDFEDIRPYLKKREEKGYLSGFEEGDTDKRLYPLKVFDRAKTIISIAMSYNFKWDKPFIQNLHGEIAKSAWGRDYHKVLNEKMVELMEGIQKEIMPMEYKMFVDTGPLSDRAIAHRAGLGRYGKNGFLINPEYGSWIFLGHILVDKEIIEDKPLEGDICNTCDLCIKTCPTGAIEGPYLFNAQKCISFLTQKKELLSYNEQRAIGKKIYGCDICQRVCPQNKDVKHTKNNNFKPEPHLAFPKLEDIIKMSNKEFKEHFKPTAAGWRGKKILQRNAIIALGNSKDVKAIPLLEDCLRDIRWEIRFYTIGALSQFGEPGKEIIEKWFNSEEHPKVKQEMEYALKL